jgi:CRISPR-associated protein Cas2
VTNFYVISYDIPDDKRRLRVARTLEAHGERVQYSVFECLLKEKDFKALCEQLRGIVEKQEDSLRIYRLCPPCVERIQTWGRASVTTLPDVFIV